MTDSSTANAFREAFRLHPAGVSVLGADDGSGPVSLTITSLISVTSEPPTVAFSLSSQSSSSPKILNAGSLVIHLLRQQDQALGQLCATKGADRFGPAVAWERLPTGEPRYTEVETWFHAKIIGTLEVNGSTLVAAELIEGHVPKNLTEPELSSMIYMDRRWHGLRQVD